MIKSESKNGRFREDLDNSIKEFNKYRSPEAIIKLLSIDKNIFLVEFSGIFCKTCGFYDYFDDFELVLNEHGIIIKERKVHEQLNGAVLHYKT